MGKFCCNLSNSSEITLKRMFLITGKSVPFYKVNIRDKDSLKRIMDEHDSDCCIHFAGLKAVGELVEKPFEYYNNNINGTLVLLDALRTHKCKNIIFSSSATVYVSPKIISITEECPKGQSTNLYGYTIMYD